MDLDRVAWAYLQQYETTEVNFTRVMHRKARRREVEPRIVNEWISRFLPRARDLDWINDERYANSRAKNWHARGWGARKIGAKLREKGVPSGLIDELMQTYGGEAHELKAAHKFARKRKIGPYRRPGVQSTPELRKKELGKLARSGFNYGVAMTVIDAEPIEVVGHSW